MEDIRFDDRLPTTESMTVLRLKQRERRRALVLGDGFGVWVHYVDRDRRSMPCRRNGCPYCPMRQHHRWYLPCVSPSRHIDSKGKFPWGKWMLELTRDCRRALGQVLAPAAMVELFRPDGDFSRTTLDVLANPFTERPVATLPWDAKAAMNAIWGLSEPPEETAEGDIAPEHPPTVPFMRGA